MKPTPINLKDIPRNKYRSRLEADWARHLEYHQAMSNYLWWAHEAIKFKIGANLWYIPDFVAQIPSGRLCCFEIKGPFSRYSGEIKFRAAVEKYPKITWIWVTRDEQGKWLSSSLPLPKKKKM